MSKYKILICGYGNIGQHLYKELEPLKQWNVATIDIYDKYKNKEINGDRLLASNEQYDYMFICVPTEMKDDGSADISQVEGCINLFTEVDTIVIKSAIPVGTAESFNKPNIVVSPEYWGTTQHCLEQDFMVLGGDIKYTEKVYKLYTEFKNGYYHFYQVDWRTAELVKYMENAWIATKVTFCNEFARIAKAFDVPYSKLRECWIADKRVSPSHTYVDEDKPYYDSHCLKKDIPAIISVCEEKKVRVPLLKEVLRSNNLERILKDIEDDKEEELPI